MDPITYFKLVSGDDIIATVLTNSESSFIITSPVKIQSIASPGGDRVMTGMLPWVPLIEFMNGKYTIDKTQIIISGEIPVDIMLRYQEVLQHVQLELHNPREGMEISDEDGEDDLETFLANIGISLSSNSGGSIH